MSYIQFLENNLKLKTDVTPESLVNSRSRDSIKKQLKKLFGNIGEKRLEQLDNGADFKDKEEELYFYLAQKYMANIEKAAVERDFDESERLYNEFIEKYDKISKNEDELEKFIDGLSNEI